MSESRAQVMVIDDEPIVGRRLLVALEAAGFEVETFVDPRDALARFEQKPFDVVVTDARMKDVDGIEVLERVRAARPGTKVILITAFASLEMARQAIARGVFDYLAKPFKVTDFLDAVRRAVGGTRAAQ